MIMYISGDLKARPEFRLTAVQRLERSESATFGEAEKSKVENSG